MRILFVSPEVPNRGGAGIATYLAEATRALSARGHECHVLTWHAGQSAAVTSALPGYVLHDYPMPRVRQDGLDDGLALSAGVADWVLDLHREHRFDIIEGTDWSAPLYCLLQRRDVERSLDDCRIVIFNHGVTYNVARHKERFTPRNVFQLVNLEHQCLALADTVVCPSVAAGNALTELHSVDRTRMRIVPEPLTPFRLAEKSAEQRRPSVLFYGSVCPSKGLRAFGRVARHVCTLHPDWPIEFMGPLSTPARAAGDFVDGIVDQLGLSGREVHFLGHLLREEALSRIGAHNLLVNMSRRETFCYAFIEGLLCGAVPLALADTAQAEFLPPHLRAMFTVGATAAAIEAVDTVALRTNWERFSEEVQQYAALRSSPDAYCNAYEQIAERRKATTVTAGQKWAEAPVSILIPAHEPDEYLLEAVQSALAQDVAPHEVIIGDDGSRRANSRGILSEVAGYSRVRVVSAPWRGLAATRNLLLDQCKTPLFGFLDADDVLAPNFVGRSREFLSASYHQSVRSVQGWYELFGTQTGIRGPVVFQHFSHCLWNDLKNNVMGVTETFRDLRYDETLQHGEAEDWEFWLRYFREGWNVRIVPGVLWRYRRHSRALSARWSEGMALGTARANAKVLGASAQSIPPHVWEFIGEYMYLGESFLHPEGSGAFLQPPCKDQRKIEARLSSFRRRGAPNTFRQRAALRVMRHLARSLA